MIETQQFALNTHQRFIDSLLNKTVLDVIVFSVIGWTGGIAAGIFFRNKAPIRNILAGIGGSYGLVLNRVSLKQYA